MSQDWRKRITWLDRSELVQIMEGLGIQAEQYGTESLRTMLSKRIEAEPMLRFELPNMHVSDN